MNNSNRKILIVDDEADILDFIAYNLRKEGFQVYTATNGKDGIQIANEKIPDLIILDVMMPEMDGIETCNALKDVPALESTIITFLTARAEEYSQMAGLEAGADDYITKPIKPKLLLAKIHSLLRRKKSNDADKRIVIKNIVIDPDKYQITIDGKPLTLPKKEFQLLLLLASKPDKVFTRDEIYNKIWTSDVVVGDRTIDVHIRKLREKLGENAIKTIKGVGYKFEDS